MKLKDEYDVIVIGCGPAGSTTAKFSAKGGAKVLVVDKHFEIGSPKRCGEGVSTRPFKELKIPFDKRFINKEIYGFSVYAPSGTLLRIKYKEASGYVIERKIFDKFLAADAARAGAKVIADTKASLLKDNKQGKILGVKLKNNVGEEREIKAKIVVAADGVDSFIARDAGINSTIKLTDIDSCFEYEMCDISIQEPDLIHLYVGNKIAPRGYCLTPDTEVFTRNTVKPIASIEVGEEVLTLNGWNKVEALSERDYKGEIIHVIPFMLNQDIKLTPDHLILTWNTKDGFTWKRASDLVKGERGKHRNGDYLVFPISKEEEKHFVDVSKYYNGWIEDEFVYPIGKNQYGTKFKYKHGIPKKLELSSELMEFFGYYVSEGSTNSNGIIIANSDEQIVKRISELGKKLFKFEPSIWANEEGNKQVQFPSVVLKKLFSKLFGVGCKKKHIPNFFYGLSEPKKKAFLKGLYLGDGTVEKSSSDGYDILSLTTTSKSLVFDTWLLAASIGVVGAIGRNKEKNVYRLRIRGKQLYKLSNIFGKLNYGGYDENRGFLIRKNKILMGIRKLEKSFYEGKVYDIQSGGSFVPSFVVHNCWIFPKDDDRANVGIGISGAEEKTAKYYLDKFILSKSFLKKGSILEVNVGVVPVGGFLENLVKDNILVVGDAARQVNPLHGGGIYESMIAGKLAGEKISRAINEKNLEILKDYEKEWWSTQGKRLKNILRIRKFAEKLTDDYIDYLAKIWSGEDLTELARGKYVEVFKKALRHPKLFKLVKNFI